MFALVVETTVFRKDLYIHCGWNITRSSAHWVKAKKTTNQRRIEIHYWKTLRWPSSLNKKQPGPPSVPDESIVEPSMYPSWSYAWYSRGYIEGLCLIPQPTHPPTDGFIVGSMIKVNILIFVNRPNCTTVNPNVGLHYVALRSNDPIASDSSQSVTDWLISEERRRRRVSVLNELYDFSYSLFRFTIQRCSDNGNDGEGAGRHFMRPTPFTRLFN